MINKIAILILMVSASCTSTAQHIGLNKKYVLSELPNYELTAPQTDQHSLTNGIFTNGHFWTNSSTVGWKNKSKISITIDLGKIDNVGSIKFNTARNKLNDVFFPEHIFAFLSNDGKNFNYVADLAVDPDNLDGTYLVKKFTLVNVNRNARYVRLTVVPKGVYLFCDEIEITKGLQEKITANETIVKEDLKKHEFFLENQTALQKRALANLDKIYANELNNSVITLSNLKRLKQEINSKTITPKTLDALHYQMGKSYAQILKNAYRGSFLVDKYKPWDKLEQFSPVKGITSNLTYDFNLPVEGVQYGAFVITNINAKTENFRFEMVETSGFNLTLFSATNVSSKNAELVPDALVPIKGSLFIPPGISQLILFKMEGKKEGVGTSMISIHMNGKSVKINVNVNTRKLVGFNSTIDLNALNWGYLTNPMLAYREKEVVNDQIAHHINTVVIPSHLVPAVGDYRFQNLQKYLRSFPNVKNILLFANYASVNNHHISKDTKLLSAEWKRSFIDWYPVLLKEISKTNQGKVYFYPFDEVEDQDIENLRNLSIWGKSKLSDFRIYGTLSRIKAAEKLIPYLDVAQLLLDLSYQPQINGKTELWLYQTKNNSRALSPYYYYRMMAWKAYFYDYKGIGFWNYADIGTVMKYNPVENNEVNWKDDYAVIYNGKNGEIFSSRRWEAFRLGLEDYRILYLYEKKFGRSATKQKIKTVVLNSASNELADQIRNDLLKNL